MTGEVKERAVRLGEVAEDATGFGEVEWRTARDLVVRPRAVLNAYESGGPTGGGLYARPTRFYLAMCGVLLFYLVVLGATKKMVEGMFPGEALARLVAASGKSREAFVSDADTWMSFAATPVLALFYALALAPAIKRWGRTNWRIAFRATLALLCAWTVPLLLLGPLPFMERFALPANIAIYVLLVVAFWRMGRGRWWTRRGEGALRAAGVLLLTQLGAAIGWVPVIGIAALGGMYGS